MFGSDLDRFTRTGIAARAGITGANGQGTKTPKLDPATVFKGLDHAFEDDANDPLNVPLGQVRIFLGELSDEFRLYHAWVEPLNS